MSILKNKVLRRKTETELTYHGVQLPYDTSIMSPVIVEAIKNGYYEAGEAKQIQNIIHEGEVIVEVGGGLGLISTLAAKNSKAKKVISYEANPRLCKYIEGVHALNGVSVSVRNKVLLPYPTTKTANFYLRRDFWASSLSPTPYGFDQEIQVEVQDLQDMIETERPTLMVVDIEGGEENFFDYVDLRGVRRVLIEVHQDVIGRKGVKKVFDALTSRGFHYDQWHSSHSVVLFSHIELVDKSIE